MGRTLAKGKNNRGGVSPLKLLSSILNLGFSIISGKLSQYRKTIKELSQKIESSSSDKKEIDEKVYYERGIAYLHLGQYIKAINDLNEAIKINSNYANAYWNRAVAYMCLQKYNQALDDFSKAISLSPNDARIYNNRGIIYSQQEQYKEEIADFSKAIELDPQYIEAYKNRAKAYKKIGREDLAAQDLAKIKELN
jgi:tetratricopeptide (TPR) repeat protein